MSILRLTVVLVFVSAALAAPFEGLKHATTPDEAWASLTDHDMKILKTAELYNMTDALPAAHMELLQSACGSCYTICTQKCCSFTCDFPANCNCT